MTHFELKVILFIEGRGGGRDGEGMEGQGEGRCGERGCCNLRKFPNYNLTPVYISRRSSFKTKEEASNT